MKFESIGIYDPTVSQFTLQDAQTSLKAALKIISQTQSLLEMYDMNGDKTLTLTDAQIILKKALKIIQ